MNIKSFMMQRSLQYAVIGMIAVVAGTIAQAAIAESPVNQSHPIQMAQASTIKGSWRLANMTAGSLPTPMLPIGDLTAEFRDAKVGGSGGCNRFNGGYSTKGSQLKIGPLASTFKACEESVMTQETRYLQALQGAQRYQVNQDGLQIFYKTKAGTGVLRFTSLDTGSTSPATPSPSVPALW